MNNDVIGISKKNIIDINLNFLKMSSRICIFYIGSK